MSRNKRPNEANTVYQNFLYGNMNPNPAENEMAVLERMYVRVLTELASNRFKWTGLPEEVNVRFMEICLFRQALSVMVLDKTTAKFMALQGAGTNYMNMVQDPTAFQVVGPNFQGQTYSARDCVPIWANQLRIPDSDIVYVYAKRLANMDRTIEINSENARQTKVIVASENQRLSAININNQVDNGRNGIGISGALQDLEFVKVLDLGVNPDTIEKLDIVRARQWNVCMGLLGIENANQDKTERLVSGEMDANNAQTASMRFVNLNERRKAAAAMNKKWGWNVEVEFHTEAEKKEALEAAQDREDSVAAVAAETSDKEITE